MSQLQEQQDSGYSLHAEHFHHTRKKWRPEVDHLIDSMQRWRNETDNKGFLLADLWCGSGRLAPILAKKFPSMSYVGIDSAEWMIALAQQEFSHFSFEHGSMNEWLRHQDQELYDCVVALASVQHLQGRENHVLMAHSLYRALQRWGRAYLINRSFSERFIKKYWKNMAQAMVHSIVKSWRSWNDLIIPWKDKKFEKNSIQFDRLYHMFTLHELRNLCEKAGFVVKECCFIGQDGVKTNDWRKARNSFVVVEKAV